MAPSLLHTFVLHRHALSNSLEEVHVLIYQVSRLMWLLIEQYKFVNNKSMKSTIISGGIKYM